MKLEQLRGIIEEAYYEVLSEQCTSPSMEEVVYENISKVNEHVLKALLTELDSEEFLAAVSDEFDIETLQIMKGVIEKRINTLNRTLDAINPRKVVKGFTGHLKEGEEGPTREYSDPTLDILQKFPTLQKTLVHLLTPQYLDFVDKVGWMAPKPSTFKVEFKNGQEITLKWMGKNFEANIEGKRYFLANLPEYQQALDKIGTILATGPIQTGMEGLEGGEGGSDVFAGAEEPAPGAGPEAGTEAGAEAGAEAPAAAGGGEDVFAGL